MRVKVKQVRALLCWAAVLAVAARSAALADPTATPTAATAASSSSSPAAAAAAAEPIPTAAALTVSSTASSPTSTTTATTTTTAATAAASSPGSTPGPSPRSPRSDASVADPLLDGDVEDDDEDGGNQKREDQAVREQHQVAILKQINRVNEDGSYTFGYEAADGSFKIETRDVLGHVKGMFGFIDEQGQLKRVSYTAANGTGFQADPTPSSASASSAAAAAGQQQPGAVYQQVIRPLPRRRPSSVRLVVPQQSAEAGGPGRAEHVIQQIPRRVRPLQQADGSVLSTVSPSSTTAAATPRASVRPVLVLATPAPGADGSTPTPAPYGQYVRRAEHPARRPVLVLGSTPAASTTTTTTAKPVTEDNEENEDDRHDRDGNELRRQLHPLLPPLQQQQQQQQQQLQQQQGLVGPGGDRDIDGLGLSGLSPGAGQLLRLLAGPAALGRGDTGDVYTGAATAAGLPQGLHALHNAPHYSGVLRQGPRALQQQLLQQHILGDLDLSPRPRHQQDYVDDYYNPAPLPPLPPPLPAPTPAAAAAVAAADQATRAATPTTAAPQLPPLQLEPAVAMALEQFLISRGIRLRPYRPPYAPPPYRMPYRAPYYDEDPYGYDPYLMRPYPMMPYHPRAYPPYDPYQQPYHPRGYPYDPYQQPYPQPYPYPQQQQLQQQQQQQQQQLFAPLRQHVPRRNGAVAEQPDGQYADPRQELLLRMLLGRTQAAQAQGLQTVQGLQGLQGVQGVQDLRAVGRVLPPRERGAPSVQQLQALQAHQQAQLYEQQQQQQLQEQLQQQQQPRLQRQQQQFVTAATTIAPVSTSARVRSVKILDPEAEGSEQSSSTARPE